MVISFGYVIGLWKSYSKLNCQQMHNQETTGYNHYLANVETSQITANILQFKHSKSPLIALLHHLIIITCDHVFPTLDRNIYIHL